MSTTARTARLATAVALGAGLALGAAAPAIAAPAASPQESSSQVVPVPGLERDASWTAAKPAWTPEHGTPVGDLFYTAADPDLGGFGFIVHANYQPSDIVLKARPLGAGASADVEVQPLWQPYKGDGRGYVADAMVREKLGDGRYELRLVVDGAELDRVDVGTFQELRDTPVPEADHSGSLQVVPFVDYAQMGVYTFEQWPTQRTLTAQIPASSVKSHDALVLGALEGLQGLDAKVTTAPQHGAGEVTADGTIVYTAAEDAGTDEFIVSVSDGKRTKTVTVRVAVAAETQERPVPGSAAHPYGQQNVHGGAPTADAAAQAQQAPAAQAPASEQSAVPAPAASSAAPHTVPDKVQTGDAAAWWLALPAAAAAGLLALVGRRRSARA